jgi:hypothetical protein
MTDFSTTLMRCHALGQIMTEPRGKTNAEKYSDAIEELKSEEIKYDAMPNKMLKTASNKMEKIVRLQLLIEELAKIKDEIQLSETCKTYLIQSYVLSKYGRVREITTKQMVKGTISEDDSILLFSALEGRIYNKNTKRISNDYISGTPDLFDTEDILNCNEIIDIKSCWDIFTFLSNVPDPEKDMYYWQLQGYMALTGAKIGTIAYCLVNTPDSIIEGEKYQLLRRMDVVTEEDPSYQKEVQLLLANRYFDDIDMSERLLTFSIDRNDEDILKIYKKVEKCREFLAEFEEMHLKFSQNYRKTLFQVN